MEAADINDARSLRAVRIVLRWTAVLMATLFIFAAGYLVSGQSPLVSRELVVVVGSVAAILIALQMLFQLALLTRAEKTEARAWLSMLELDARREHVRLVSRLSGLLTRARVPKSVAATAVEFSVMELGASCAAFWSAGGDGLPAQRAEWRRKDGPRRLNDTERSSLAQKAVLTREASWAGDVDAGEALTIFLPLPGLRSCQGVLEIEFEAGGWHESYRDFLPELASQVGSACDRARGYEDMQKRADLDFVTGVYNHRFMHEYLEKAVRAARTRNRGVAIVFMDVDNFKAFNDSLGHGVGDRVLQTVAQQLRLTTDRVGVVGRSGGDEFMVVLPNHTASQTRALIEAFQDWMSISAPPVQGMFRIQMSCGYAVMPDDGETASELLAAADARLYRAKARNGRPVDGSGAGNGAGERTLGVYGLLDRLLDGIHEKDNYTRSHCEKAAEYASAFAQALGLSPSAHRSLRLAALLHDVGKVGVPEHILCKPGPLTDQEIEIVRHHVEVATQLIVDVPNADEVRAVVRHHRERWDGSGYPHGLVGDAIPYLSRVLAVADAYAAITLDRPYGAALSPEDAHAELKRVAGTQLDPELVEAFGAIVTAESDEPAAAPAI